MVLRLISFACGKCKRHPKLTPIVLVSFAKLSGALLDLAVEECPVQHHTGIVLARMPLSVHRVAAVVGELTEVFHIGGAHRNQLDAFLLASHRVRRREKSSQFAGIVRFCILWK